MKRLFFTLLMPFILYAIYYDLTYGTLPAAMVETIDYEPFVTVTVEPGETVLSIMEQLHNKPITFSIQEIIYDFKQLNDGLAPEQMQIGKPYRFPLYE